MIFNDIYQNVFPSLMVKPTFCLTDPPYLFANPNIKKGTGKMFLSAALHRQGFNMRDCGAFGEAEINEFLNSLYGLNSEIQSFIFCSEKQLPFYLVWCLTNKKLFNVLPWCKPLSILNRERFSTNVEFIVRIYDNGNCLNKVENSRLYSKWKDYKPINGKKKLHPAEKPKSLLIDILQAAARIDDIVIDPFMGAGSTGIACKELVLEFIGIEKEKKYFDIAIDAIGDNNDYKSK